MNARRFIVVALVVTLVTVPLAACAPTAPTIAGSAPGVTVPGAGHCTAVGQTAHTNVNYDPAARSALTVLDVYQPTLPPGCPPAPVLVWVHGGGLTHGDKTNNIADKKRLAEAHGWGLVAVNYRLAPRVTYPTFNQDVGNAVSWTIGHAANYGLDPNRVALMGHSSGGGLVAAVSTDPTYLGADRHHLSDLTCTIALDGAAYEITNDPQYRVPFGANLDHWPAASPINHVAPDIGIPPFFIVTRDPATNHPKLAQFEDHAHQLGQALQSAGIPVTSYATPDLTHDEISKVIGSTSDHELTPRIVAFLDACYSKPAHP